MQFLSAGHFHSILTRPLKKGTHRRHAFGGARRIEMRDQSKNRKLMQRGRYLSSEAIQTVQSLKWDPPGSEEGTRGARAKVQRLIKKDMVAAMRELL